MNILKGTTPVRDQQGNAVANPDGTPQMRPRSAKELGFGILAGALAGLVAGASTPPSYTRFGNASVPDYSGAVAAGAQAAQPFTTVGQKATAQEQLNQIDARHYATMDHNLKLHMAYLSNLKMQGDLLDQGTDEDEPLIEGLKTADPIPDPKDPTKTIEPIQAQGVTEQQLLPMMKDGNVTRQSILRDGKAPVVDANGKPVLNDDGTPKMQWTYTVYNQRAMVAMSDDMRGLNHALDKVAVGTPVPIAVLAKYALQNTQARGAQQSVDNKLKEISAVIGKDVQSVDLKTTADAGLIKSIYPWIAKYGTEPVDLMFKDLRAQKEVPGAAVAALAHAMGADQMVGNQTVLEKMTSDRIAATAENKTPSYAEAIAIKNDPNASPALKTKAAGIIKDTDDAAIAKENRINDNKAKLENDKQTQKDIRTHVYAMDSEGNLILSNYHDNPGGETVKDGDIMKDRGAMRQLDDVQMNNSMYRVAMTKPITANDRDKLQELEALNQQNGGNLVSFGQGGVSLNIPVVSAKLNKQNLKQMTDDLNALSPNARLRYAGYLRTAASVPAYAKAISGTARQNKETLELEMANIPKPYLDDATAKVQQDAWQDNITRAANGYPTNLPGMVHPNQLRNQIADPKDPSGRSILVLLPTGQTAGPFKNQAAADAFKKEAGI